MGNILGNICFHWTEGMEDDVQFLVDVATSHRNSGLVAPAVVLVGSGSFCPAHRGHLLMMRSAAKALKGYRVIGAVLIPACEDYINAEHADEPIPFRLSFELREKLLEGTAHELGFSSVDRDDADFPVHICHAEQEDREHGIRVIGHLRELYNRKRASTTPRPPDCPALVWVNGDDKPYMLRTPTPKRNTDERGADGVVVVSRHEELIPTLARVVANGSLPRGLKQIGECEPGGQDLSSAGLRRAVKTALVEHADEGAEAYMDAVVSAAAQFMSAGSAQIYAKHLLNPKFRWSKRAVVHEVKISIP